MKERFDNEEFLREIHTVPSWVKNGDDLLKFCRHIMYRLLKEKAVNIWYQKNTKLEDDQYLQVLKIQIAYDDVYNNNVSQFQPFEQIFN